MCGVALVGTGGEESFRESQMEAGGGRGWLVGGCLAIAGWFSGCGQVSWVGNDEVGLGLRALSGVVGWQAALGGLRCSGLCLACIDGYLPHLCHCLGDAKANLLGYRNGMV